MQAKLDLYLWLGPYEPKKTVKEYLKGLPEGYDMTAAMQKSPVPPQTLVYPGTASRFV